MTSSTDYCQALHDELGAAPLFELEPLHSRWPENGTVPTLVDSVG